MMAGRGGYGQPDQAASMQGGGHYGNYGGYGPTATQPGDYHGNYVPTTTQPGYPSPGGFADPYGQQGGYDLKAYSAKGTNVNDLFFVAACCVVAGSLIAGTGMLFSFELVDFVHTTYLLMLGGILGVLDTPILKTIKAVTDAQMYIHKYIQFVTRITGKGATFVFLGSALFLIMWDNNKGALWSFLAVILSFFPIATGIGAVGLGILKSSKLDKARKQLHLVIEARYDHVAQTYRGPQGGLTMAEFNNLTTENGGYRFEALDLKLIFNALVSKPAWRSQEANGEVKIPKQDLLDWCAGGMVFL